METRTMWKYQLPDISEYTGEVLFLMPAGAEIKTLSVQGDHPCLWALVNPDAKREKRKFEIRRTGFKYPEPFGEYVGTWQEAGGRLVWHLFELPTEPEPE